jgi:sortase A
MRSLRRWLKASNGLIAIGIVLTYAGVRGAVATAGRFQDPGQDSGLDVASADPASRLPAPIFLPPTLVPIQTATPFSKLLPMPGAPALEGEQVPQAVNGPPKSTTGYPPQWLSIPSIHLDAPVEVSRSYQVSVRRQKYEEWAPPSAYAAGWQEGSAPLGVVGNTVLNGHNNEYGDVFAHLEDVQIGDTISVTSQGYIFIYRVTNRMILADLYQELEIRTANAQWIQPSQDERLTLVTCWPRNGNSHRLILVAQPMN